MPAVSLILCQTSRTQSLSKVNMRSLPHKVSSGMNDAQARYERRGHVNHPKSSDYVMFLASNACLCFYTILLQNFHTDCQANVRLFMHETTTALDEGL